MSHPVTIGLLGDFNPAEVRAHAAIPVALGLAAKASGLTVNAVWLATRKVERPEFDLGRFEGLWCVPGSPYQSMEGALRGIQFARVARVPFLGTCGGFQHAVIEFARDLAGWREADHAESNPGAALPLVSRLACSLAGATGEILLVPNSKTGKLYGQPTTVEQFNCNFGVNPEYDDLFQNSALRVAGTSREGGVRIVELADHPFFVATLFQPELSAFSGNSHPLIMGFLASANHFSLAVSMQ